MKVITVYGTLKDRIIYTDEGNYPLITNNHLRLPYKGWFQIEKSGDKWILWRTLFQDWTDSYIDEDGSFVERVSDGSR